MSLPSKLAKSKGFTLIELLIVVVILGALASVVVISFPGASKSARDGRRREELQQYRAALEIYANRSNGLYPVQTTVGPVTNLCSGATPPLGTNCPVDPKNGTSTCHDGAVCRYNYVSDATGTVYALWATLEKPVDITTPKPCSVICSNGLSGEDTCPTSSVCTLP